MASRVDTHFELLVEIGDDIEDLCLNGALLADDVLQPRDFLQRLIEVSKHVLKNSAFTA